MEMLHGIVMMMGGIAAEKKARNGAQGTPVYDAKNKVLLLQYMQLVPVSTVQLKSLDHGASWTVTPPVCKSMGDVRSLQLVRIIHQCLH